MGDGTKYVGCLTLVSGEGTPTGTFSGDVTLTGITEGAAQTFHFYYLGSTAAPAVDATEVDVDFSSQNIYNNSGKLENASKHHVGYGSANGTVKDGVVTGINVTLVSKVALARFSFKKDDTDYKGALTLSGEHIYNKMTVNFSVSDFSFNGTKGNISLTGGHGERYVMLVPTGSTAEETLNFVGGATGSTTLENGIEANKFYGRESAMVVPLPHETVNFGTPDLNWSVCNLGATNGATDESWYGDYYAWGETAPYYQNGSWCEHPSHDASITFDASVGYGWKNYLDGTSTEWNASLDWKPYGSGNILTSTTDAATAAWGGDWRMPTSAEWKALYDNNTFEVLEPGAASEYVTSFTAVARGYLVVKGKDTSLDPSVSMFLPAAGHRKDVGKQNVHVRGYYWSSSLYSETPAAAFAMYFATLGDEIEVLPQDWYYRVRGFSVRPVLPAR